MGLLALTLLSFFGAFLFIKVIGVALKRDDYLSEAVVQQTIVRYYTEIAQSADIKDIELLSDAVDRINRAQAKMDWCLFCAWTSKADFEKQYGVA